MNERYNIVIPLLSVAVLAIMLISSNAYATTPKQFVSNEEGGIVITPASNGYLIANIPQIYPFNFTLNGSYFQPYLSYITPTSTGFSLNGSIYALGMNQAAAIRSTPNYTYYAKLVNISYYSKPQNVNIYVYSVLHYSALQTTLKTSSSIASTTTIMPTTTEATSTVAAVEQTSMTPQAEEESIGLIIIIVLVIAGILYYVIRMSRTQKPKNKK